MPSIAIAEQPDKWASVYRPIRFEFKSDFYPNVRFGESNIPVIDITQDDTGVRVRISSQFATSDLSPGDTIQIAGTDFGLYDGTHRVTTTFESGGNLIAYIATEYAGDDYNGTASRYYSGIVVVANVTFNNGNVVTYEIEPNENGRFVLNIEEAASCQFERIFDTVSPATAWNESVDGRPSIAMEYSLSVYEQWTRWDNGAPSIDNNSKDATILRGFRAVNCVHPYHKIEAGAVSFNWSKALEPVFVMRNGETKKRFLTWSRAKDRKASTSDPFFVSFLLDTDSVRTFRVMVTTYSANGTAMATQISDPLPSYTSATVNAGPAEFPSIVNDFVEYYTIRILDGPSAAVLSEDLAVYLDRSCAEVNRRLFWRNKMGGMDQYTMKGRETEFPSAIRSTLRRTNGRLASDAPLGTWMERTHKVDPVRRHILTSELIGTETMRWLNDDCFESADIAVLIDSPRWTNLVPVTVDGQSISTKNDNGRFIVEYYYGMDNRSQRA